MVDLGERVLVLSHFHARGRDGIKVTRSFAHVWTVEDGRVVRLDAYADQQKALDAVGLSD
jgi:ketosteroid isomerase-like protein